MIEKQIISLKNKDRPFTRFWDMHSWGKLKTNWHYIYVNLPKEEAVDWFQRRFNRDPYNVTGGEDDYSIDSAETLEQLTEFHRHQIFIRRAEKSNPSMTYEEYKNIADCIPLDEFLAMDDVLYVEVIYEQI